MAIEAFLPCERFGADSHVLYSATLNMIEVSTLLLLFMYKISMIQKPKQTADSLLNGRCLVLITKRTKWLSIDLTHLDTSWYLQAVGEVTISVAPYKM